MLEIRHKDGRITATGYSWLPSAEFDPSTGIVKRCSHATGCGCKPCSKSTALLACDAAVKTARLSSFRTFSHSWND
jgi:hypothetical protein